MNKINFRDVKLGQRIILPTEAVVKKIIPELGNNYSNAIRLEDQIFIYVTDEVEVELLSEPTEIQKSLIIGRGIHDGFAAGINKHADIQKCHPTTTLDECMNNPDLSTKVLWNHNAGINFGELIKAYEQLRGLVNNCNPSTDGPSGKVTITLPKEAGGIPFEEIPIPGAFIDDYDGNLCIKTEEFDSDFGFCNYVDMETGDLCFKDSDCIVQPIDIDIIGKNKREGK